MYEHVAVSWCAVLCCAGQAALSLETVLLLDALVFCCNNPVGFTRIKYPYNRCQPTALLLQQHRPQRLHNALPACCRCLHHPSQSHCHSHRSPSCSILSSNTCHSSRLQPVMPGRAPLSANSRPNTTMAAQAARFRQQHTCATCVSNVLSTDMPGCFE